MTTLRPTTDYYSCSLHDPVKILASPQCLVEIKPQTIPQFFKQCCQQYQNLPALAFKTSPKTPREETSAENIPHWTTISYKDYTKHVEQAALALLHLEVKPLLASNCPEWFFIHLGAIHINAISAGIYTTNSAETVLHVLKTSDASVVVVEDQKQMEKIRAIRSQLPNLHAVIQLRGPYDFREEDKNNGYYRWSDLVEMHYGQDLQGELHLREKSLAPNECALLIFTSGTTGMPKGVMISHDAILYAAQAASKVIPNLKPGNEIILSYLPLNHIAAQFFDIFMPMAIGGQVFFADGDALRGFLAKAIREVRPTLLLGMPRVFEKLQEKLMDIEAKYWRVTKTAMEMARTAMMQHYLSDAKGKPTLSYCLYSYLVKQCKINLGLDRIKSCFIGGAPVSRELKLFFSCIATPLNECFGLSESSGIVFYNFQRYLSNAAGKPLGDIEVKIRKINDSEQGEVLMRGRMNFMGYLKDPEKTRETLTKDGWIHTGDLGLLDANGNLVITGRIKELIITAGGENMPPNYIEALIKKELPCLSNVIAIGDRRKYVTALLTFKTLTDLDTGLPLDTLLPETLDWLASLGLHYSSLSEMLHIRLPENLRDFDPNSVQVKLDEKLKKALEMGIKRANQLAISNAQRVQYFSVLPHDFSIPTGEIGPTLKSRRQFIEKKYAPIIDKMYKK